MRGYFLDFDEMSSQDIDDQDKDEYEGLYRKLLGHCSVALLCWIYIINKLNLINVFQCSESEIYKLYFMLLCLSLREAKNAIS